MNTSVSKALKNINQTKAVAKNRKKGVKVFPTGLNKFDSVVLGTGGLVAGRVYELYAKSSAGKTTLALKIAAHFQKMGLLASYFDAEEALSVGDWVSSIGVDIDQLIMPEFQSGEEAFNLMKILMVSGVNLIVVDTMALLMPEALLSREDTTKALKMNESQARAKMLTAGLNDIVGGFRVKREGSAAYMSVPKDRLEYLRGTLGKNIKDDTVHKLSYYDTVLIGVNHAKDNIGVMYGDTTYTPGGDSLTFHSSVRIGMSDPLRSKEKVTDPETGAQVPLFRKTRVTAAKNKLAAPFGEVTLKVFRDGRVLEDIVFWQEAVKLGKAEANIRYVTWLETGEKYTKKEFELWASEHPEKFEGKLDEKHFEDEVEDDAEDKSTVTLPKGNAINILSSIKKSKK